MPNPSRPANISFDFALKRAQSSEPIDEDAPLRIAILGSFSGRSTAGARRAVKVDCDNFDTAVTQFGASLHLPAGTAGSLEIDVAFKKLDDFHPDQLLKNIAPLTNLVHLRSRLLSSATADDATAELRGLYLGGAAPVAPATIDAPAAEAPSGESLADTMARLMGGTVTPPPAPAKPAAPKSIIDSLLKQAVTSTASSARTPEQTQLLTILESDLAERLRKILHDPRFQEIESAWRGLDFLVRESNDSVELYVIDILRDELNQQLASQENPAATLIGRQLEDIGANAVLNAWTYSAVETPALQQLARLGAACGTAIIAGGASDLVGCASFGSQPNPVDWTATGGLAAFAELRRRPEAAHLGLITPRFVLRLPYGKDIDPIQSFPFEELHGGDSHEAYLWGSSAFLCGHRLVNSFADDGWDMELGGAGGEVGGLPVHSFKVDGEKQAKPCAEAWLSEKAADLILSHGLMPALSVRGRDSVIVVSLRSISDPASALQFRVG